jgi:L-lactate dehydrogenase
MGVKVSIIGSGRVGSMLTYLLISNKKIDEIVLIDKIQSRVDGTILDVSHAYPEYSSKLKSGSYKNVERSKVIIITAGFPRVTNDGTRMDLLDVNKPILKEIIESIKVSEDSVIIILTNPVEPLVYFTYKLLKNKIKKTQVIGFSNILDSARLRFILSKSTNEDPKKVEGLVIGEHGENMILASSACKVNGKPLQNLDLEFVRNELKNSSKKILECLGGTQFGPSRHAASLVNAILNNTNEVFSVSFCIEKDDNYKVSDVCISVPVVIGSNGVKKIKRMNLNENEKKSLLKLAEKLKTVQKNMGI